MENNKEKSLSRAARYARNAALASLPLGILVGLMLSSGQDAAGAGLGFGMGLALGLVAFVIFGLCYWVLKSVRRTQLLFRFGWIPVLVFAIWFAVHSLRPEKYTLSVRNVSGEDLTEIELQLADFTFSIRDLRDGGLSETEGLEVPPESELAVSWVDADGGRQSVLVESREPPYYGLDGGVLVVFLYPQNEVVVFFAWHERPLF